jgi:sn-glycerol 3-phosphate transport system substrate-binding protein
MIPLPADSSPRPPDGQRPPGGHQPADRHRRGDGRPRSRRRRSLLAGAAAATLVVAACSSGSSDSTTGASQKAAELPPCPLSALDSATQPVEVVVWHTQTAKPGETLKELAAEYNAKQSKVKISLESQGADYQELQKKFNSAVPSRQLPGVVMVDDTFTQSMADSEVILPAQSCIEADRYDMAPFAKTAKDYYTIQGTLWPASANLGNVLLFYNRDHFRKAGLDPDKPPATLDEVRTYAEKIKAAGIADKPLVHEFASWKTEFWLTGARSSVVTNDNGRGSGTTDKAALVGNPQATELFEWFKGMQDAGLIEAIPATPGQINQYLAMAQQKSSMLVDTSSAATSIEAFLGGEQVDTGGAAGTDLNSVNVSGLDLTAGPFPVLENPGKTQVGGAAWYITNTTKPEVQAAAWDFLKFMNTPESQARMFTGGSFLPYNTAAADLPAMQTAFTATLSGRWLKIAYDQVLAIDPSFPGPLIGPYDEFRQSVNSAQDQLMFNNKPPAEALQQAQTEIDSLLTRYNRELGN